jgi:hypothetical protein
MEVAMIEPVDSLEITVLVDNVTDNLSSNPKYVETEVAGALRRGMNGSAENAFVAPLTACPA